MLFSLLTIASGLALTLVAISYRRIRNEGLTLSAGKRQHFVRSIEDVQKQLDHDKAMADEHDISTTGEIIYSKAGFGRKLQVSVQEGTKILIAALEGKGYRSLLRSDVVKSVERSELPPCQTLLVYHPELAGRAFALVPHVGLPVCQAVIRQDMSDTVYAEFLDPTLVSPLARYPELGDIALRMKTDLLSILQAI